MYRDVSEIRDTGCNVLNASNQITNYSGKSRIQYTYIGNEYKEYARSTSTYDYDTSGYVCYSKDQIMQLQSDYDAFTPIYEVMALILGLGLFYTAYKIFIHPFWRRV